MVGMTDKHWDRFRYYYEDIGDADTALYQRWKYFKSFAKTKKKYYT